MRCKKIIKCTIHAHCLQCILLCMYLNKTIHWKYTIGWLEIIRKQLSWSIIVYINDIDKEVLNQNNKANDSYPELNQISPYIFELLQFSISWMILYFNFLWLMLIRQQNILKIIIGSKNEWYKWIISYSVCTLFSVYLTVHMFR